MPVTPVSYTHLDVYKRQLMLVVAMIPVGAAAADDPTVYVDNQLATLSGTVYTVTAKSTEVTVTTVPQDGVTPVSYTHLDVYKRQEQC